MVEPFDVIDGITMEQKIFRTHLTACLLVQVGIAKVYSKGDLRLSKIVRDMIRFVAIREK